jgi:hypothetical protein
MEAEEPVGAVALGVCRCARWRRHNGRALWLPTSREAKYKAKAAVDTFFMRGGDVLQAGIVFLGAMAGAT